MKFRALPEAMGGSTCRRAVSRVSVSVVAAVRREAIHRLKPPSPALPSPLPGLLQGAALLGVAASLLLAPPAVHAKTVSGLTSDVTVVGEHACEDACPCATCPCAICPMATPVSRVTGPCACTYPHAALPCAVCPYATCHMPMHRAPSAHRPSLALVVHVLVPIRALLCPPMRHAATCPCAAFPCALRPMRCPSHAPPPLQYDGAGIIAQEKETQLSKELAELERWFQRVQGCMSCKAGGGGGGDQTSLQEHAECGGHGLRSLFRFPLYNALYLHSNLAWEGPIPAHLHTCSL